MLTVTSCYDVADLGIGAVNQGMGSNPPAKHILSKIFPRAWLQRGEKGISSYATR